jgi:hypothetical protein
LPEIRDESKILWAYLIFFEVKNGSKNRPKLYFFGLVNIIQIIQQGKIALKTGPYAPNKGLFARPPSPHLLPNEKLTFLICGAFVGGFVI